MRLFDSVLLVAVLAFDDLCTLAVKSSNDADIVTLRSQSGRKDDESIQRRVGPTEATTTRFYREQQPVVYQRTMVRNPEDAFTQTIQTEFQCPRGRPGYYADIQNQCRVFHICHEYLTPDGEPHSVKYSQFCSPGTIFDQLTLTCTFVWAAVPCGSANQFYYINSNLYQPDAQLISDDDVRRGRSLISGPYRSSGTEAGYAAVTNTASQFELSAPVVQPHVSATPARRYETASYVSGPAVLYRSHGGPQRLSYESRVSSSAGADGELHVKRTFAEARTRYDRPADSYERLETTPRPQRQRNIGPQLQPQSRVHLERVEKPNVPVPSVHKTVSTSNSPHMLFLGFPPIDQNVAAYHFDPLNVARSYHYSDQNRASIYRSYDSRQHQNGHSGSRVDAVSDFTPARYVREEQRAYREKNHSSPVPSQRPLIPTSDFPGFRDGSYKSSLSIQHNDPSGHHHSHHQKLNTQQGHPESVATDGFTPAPPVLLSSPVASVNPHQTEVTVSPHYRVATVGPQQSVAAVNTHHPVVPVVPVPGVPVPVVPVPVVPVTGEIRTAQKSLKVIEQTNSGDEARGTSAASQYESRQEFGRPSVNHGSADFVQEPLVVRGGRNSKTLLFPDEVPYLKRTARSHKELVEPAFKSASAIPGIIPNEYLIV